MNLLQVNFCLNYFQTTFVLRQASVYLIQPSTNNKEAPDGMKQLYDNDYTSQNRVFLRDFMQFISYYWRKNSQSINRRQSGTNWQI